MSAQVPLIPVLFCLSRHRLSITLWSRRKAEVSKFPGSSRFGDCQRCLVTSGIVPAWQNPDLPLRSSPAPPPPPTISVQKMVVLGVGWGTKGDALCELEEGEPQGSCLGEVSWSPQKGVCVTGSVSPPPSPPPSLSGDDLSLCWCHPGASRAGGWGKGGVRAGGGTGSGSETEHGGDQSADFTAPPRSLQERPCGKACWEKWWSFGKEGAAPQLRAGERGSL